jgi:predicted nuclease with TOPRIM domain
MDWKTDILAEMAKVLGGGTAGVFGGMWAERKAAKSDAVKELQVLKGEYREFADTMKNEVKQLRVELADSRAAERLCDQNFRELRQKHDDLDAYVRRTTGIPKKG